MLKTTRGLAALLLTLCAGVATKAGAQLQPPDLSVYYPPRAQRMSKSGQAMIDCAAALDGRLSDCKLLLETPEGWGFGEAAIRAAHAGVIRRRPIDMTRRITATVSFDNPDSAVRPPRPATPVRRPAGEPTVAASVMPTQTILSYPFAFGRTAVLTQDITNVNPLLKVVRVKAGAPGYFLGAFGGAHTGPAGREIWCFLGAPERLAPVTKEFKPAEWVCHQLPEKGGANPPMSEMVSPRNPYVATQVWSSSEHKVSFGPVFEEKPVELPVKLKIEYRFKRWTKTGAEVEQWAGGFRGETEALERQADGGVILTTPVGSYRLTPAPRRGATVTAIP